MNVVFLAGLKRLDLSGCFSLTGKAFAGEEMKFPDLRYLSLRSTFRGFSSCSSWNGDYWAKDYNVSLETGLLNGGCLVVVKSFERVLTETGASRTWTMDNLSEWDYNFLFPGLLYKSN